jgi:hypothetical protein
MPYAIFERAAARRGRRTKSAASSASLSSVLPWRAHQRTHGLSEVKIECGARSDDWPAEAKTIRPYVADAVRERITDADASIKVLAVERTFWEKATILHAETHRDSAKATPTRFSRHYADLAALAAHPSAATALTRDDLRARFVEHKQVFFAAAWAKYDTAMPGSFRLIPPDYRLAAFEADYRAMREMYFEQPLLWPEIIERLRTLEAKINQQTH